jgi:hypothetical protein
MGLGAFVPAFWRIFGAFSLFALATKLGMKPTSAAALGSGKRVPLDYNSNPRSATAITNAERRAFCKANRRQLFFGFPRIGALSNSAPEMHLRFLLI